MIRHYRGHPECYYRPACVALSGPGRLGRPAPRGAQVAPMTVLPGGFGWVVFLYCGIPAVNLTLIVILIRLVMRKRRPTGRRAR